VSLGVSRIEKPVSSKEGDGDEFDAFFRAERDRLVAQAFLLVGESHAAQDLAQRTFERAWGHWNKIRRYEQPGAWARRVLFNMALNERRHWGREQPLGDKEPDAAEAPEEHLELVSALRLLPPDQRRAIVMHDALGFSVAEVAGELGVPEGTVKSWLSRGRSRLAQELERSPSPSGEHKGGSRAR
jgi:RNA polymerase sigma-70 factor (ECF subfamily)